MLTKKMLEAMPPKTIFATGLTEDSPYGINMTRSQRPLKWVAVRGGIPDWCIYIYWAENDIEWIRSHGDKVCGAHNIRKLVECDDEAFSRYRY